MFEKSQTGTTTVDLEPKLSSYEDFHPFAELNTEDKDNNILTVHLPGFQKQQIIITMARPSHKIRIRGQRIDENYKWQKFNQSYKVPENSSLSKIQARWEKEVLTITMPKGIVIAKAKDEAAVKNKGEKQIMISTGMLALAGVLALAGAALGAYVCCIIGSKSSR